jgi:hypothetical protein
MKPVTEPILCAAASAFDFGGPMVCDPHHYGEGHINDTFVVWRPIIPNALSYSVSTPIHSPIQQD